MSTGHDPLVARPPHLQSPLEHELQHLCSHWIWFVLLGVLLLVSGTLAIVVPAATVGVNFAAIFFFGILLMIGGIATIITAFWAGRWSGFLLYLLVGILYLACGFVMTEQPVIAADAITIVIAVTFVALGVFRTIAALTLRFPQWGWVLLSGVITLLAGIIIYRQRTNAKFWVIGLLIGLEMLFHGWTWMMIGMALRAISHRLSPPQPRKA